MLYIYFLCLTNENIFEWRCPSSFPTFRAFCYLHSFESWRLVLLYRCLPYRGFTLKTFINSDAFYDFATVNGNPSAVATRQFFPFHAGQTSIPFYGDFGSSLCLGQTFCIQTDWCWLLHFSRTILILLLSLYVYNSFTLDCFTLLVVLPKNKIRSIINSFKLLNSERRDF